MAQLELVILLLVAVLAATALARRLVVPYPIFLVLVGLALGLAPGLPPVHLAPDLVFLVFLPPILWAAAYFTSFRDFRANLRPILLLAVGLVLASTAAVAGVAHAIFPGLGWATAIALGAIVSPPDAVAATAIAGRLGIPRRVVTILEGESLVNDAAALVLYRVAVGAVVTGQFVASDALAQFVLAPAVGVAIGIAVGVAIRLAMRAFDDPGSEIALTLLAPYVAWVLAERAHASGVLACVAGGIYLRRHFSTLITPDTRLQARAVWDLLIFVLNGLVFILIGLQIGALREVMPRSDLRSVLLAATMITLTLIAVRLVWVPLFSWLPRRLSARLRLRDPMPPRTAIALISWIAMRGIVSLAAALALPLATADGRPFPFRDELVLLTFAVVLATLVLQGLTLAPIVRRLELPVDATESREEIQARSHAAVSALRRLAELEHEPWVVGTCVGRLRAGYEERLRRVSQFGVERAIADATLLDEDETARRLQHEMLTAERSAMIQLRNGGVVSDDVLHRLERELDVEALRLGIGGRRA